MATTNLSNLQQGQQQQTARRPKTIFDFLDDPRVQKGIGAVARAAEVKAREIRGSLGEWPVGLR